MVSAVSGSTSRIIGRPLFFNPEPQRLFGVYYQPTANITVGPAVLICPPFGNEYVRSYNAIRKLCERLSQNGFPVLKFDYCGLGDSYGDGTKANVGEWRANIRAAASELCRQCGQTRITVVGLRLGAALAAGIVLDGIELTNLVFWDPVVKGADYLAELERAHRLCLTDTFRFRRTQRHRLTHTERLGFRFPLQMQQSIAELNLLDKTYSYENCFLVTSAERAEYESMAENLNRDLRRRFTREFVKESTGWGEYSQAETTLRINRTVTSIANKISNGFV
jgi:pimeloyl-ACP methyl ester carboxylesterase